MARRRYQRGHLPLRGKKEKVWVAKWREDVLLADGSVHRVQKGEVLGTVKEYKRDAWQNVHSNSDSPK